MADITFDAATSKVAVQWSLLGSVVLTVGILVVIMGIISATKVPTQHKKQRGADVASSVIAIVFGVIILALGIAMIGTAKK